MKMSNSALTKRIHAYDFALLELGLYLDTHTWDRRALHRRQELLAERKSAVAAYEEAYGPYIVNWNQVKGNRWSWVNDPWPWEYCFKED